jgi:hypothetical protein
MRLESFLLTILVRQRNPEKTSRDRVFWISRDGSTSLPFQRWPVLGGPSVVALLKIGFWLRRGHGES